MVGLFGSFFLEDWQVILLSGKKQLPPVRIATDADIPAGPMSLSRAIESGSRLDELRAMRRIIVAHIESENALTRDIPPLSRQLREISKEIETLSIQESESYGSEVRSSYGDGDAEWKPTAI